MRRHLNVGCGDKPSRSTDQIEWINLDAVPRPGVDVVRDVRRGFPFDDATFDHVLLDNVLEHFASPDVVFIINEIDRVLKEGGTAEIIVPHAHSQGAVQDPTHLSLFVPRCALYWNQTESKYGGRFVGITANFDATSIEVYGDKETELFIRFNLRKTPDR